jgi:DNA polymerase
MRRRGVVGDAPGDLPMVVATVHPSSILRVPEDERRLRMDQFVDDLRLAANLLAKG